jgi:acetyltransferase-like isoleucine patch superfamily enzyme
MIHPTAEVQSKNIGQGTNIWQNCVILKDAVIGKNCNINYNVFIENDVLIGDNVTIKPGVQIWDGLRIGSNVFISPNVTFTNDLTPRSKHHSKKFLTTRIMDGASIGANSTIIGGITIGKFAMIGAGSVVTKDIPKYTLWYGNPATFRAYVCKCGHKLDENFKCISCNKAYKKSKRFITGNNLNCMDH